MDMDTKQQYIVTVNAGSSSIKLAVFTTRDLQKKFEAAVENIGLPSSQLIAEDSNRPVTVQDHAAAAALLAEWLRAHVADEAIFAVGHRIVHGGPKYYKPQPATDEVLEDLRTFEAFDPEHLPTELALVETFQKSLPNAQHVLCFDTAFHHDLPTRSRLLPIPRQFETKGIRRYGFHGLSYAYIG